MDRSSNDGAQRSDSDSLPDTDQVPLAHDVGARAASALRVGFGALIALWGVETLTPVASAFILLSGDRPEDAWFTSAVGAVLVTSGAMTITNKLVPLAMTLLMPMSLYVLFQLAHI